MSIPSFELVRPRTLEAAIEALGRYGPECQILAGGTDVVPSLKQRLFAPRVVLDIKPLRELDDIHYNPEEGLVLGALTRISMLARSALIAQHFPVLREAAKTIASPLLRNMGTLGGNLCLDTRCLYYNQSLFWRQALGYCLKKDGSRCHVAPGGRFCWAVFSGDLAPALMVLGARLEVAGPRGSREVSVEEFYSNDGITRMNKAPDEMVTRVRVPASSADWSGSYKKLRIRASIDYPLAGVATVMRKDASGVCLGARVALTAVNPAPKLVKAASALEGKRYDPEIVEEVAHEAIRTGKPLRTSSSTPEYRRHMIRVFVRRALRELWADGASASSPR